MCVNGILWSSMEQARRTNKGQERGASCRLDSQGNVRFSGAAPSYAQVQQGNGALPTAAAYHNMLQQNGSFQPGRRVAMNRLSAAPCCLAVGGLL
jgi:hypothetical protein